MPKDRTSCNQRNNISDNSARQLKIESRQLFRKGEDTNHLAAEEQQKARRNRQIQELLRGLAQQQLIRYNSSSTPKVSEGVSNSSLRAKIVQTPPSQGSDEDSFSTSTSSVGLKQLHTESSTTSIVHLCPPENLSVIQDLRIRLNQQLSKTTIETTSPKETMGNEVSTLEQHQVGQEEDSSQTYNEGLVASGLEQDTSHMRSSPLFSPQDSSRGIRNNEVSPESQSLSQRSPSPDALALSNRIDEEEDVSPCHSMPQESPRDLHSNTSLSVSISSPSENSTTTSGRTRGKGLFGRRKISAKETSSPTKESTTSRRRRNSISSQVLLANASQDTSIPSPTPSLGGRLRANRSNRRRSTPREKAQRLPTPPLDDTDPKCNELVPPLLGWQSDSVRSLSQYLDAKQDDGSMSTTAASLYHDHDSTIKEECVPDHRQIDMDEESHATSSSALVTRNNYDGLEQSRVEATWSPYAAHPRMIHTPLSGTTALTASTVPSSPLTALHVPVLMTVDSTGQYSTSVEVAYQVARPSVLKLVGLGSPPLSPTQGSTPSQSPAVNSLNHFSHLIQNTSGLVAKLHSLPLGFAVEEDCIHQETPDLQQEQDMSPQQADEYYPSEGQSTQYPVDQAERVSTSTPLETSNEKNSEGDNVVVTAPISTDPPSPEDDNNSEDEAITVSRHHEHPSSPASNRSLLLESNPLLGQEFNVVFHAKISTPRASEILDEPITSRVADELVKEDVEAEMGESARNQQAIERTEEVENQSNDDVNVACQDKVATVVTMEILEKSSAPKIALDIDDGASLTTRSRSMPEVSDSPLSNEDAVDVVFHAEVSTPRASELLDESLMSRVIEELAVEEAAQQALSPHDQLRSGSSNFSSNPFMADSLDIVFHTEVSTPRASEILDASISSRVAEELALEACANDTTSITPMSAPQGLKPHADFIVQRSLTESKSTVDARTVESWKRVMDEAQQRMVPPEMGTFVENFSCATDEVKEVAGLQCDETTPNSPLTQSNQPFLETESILICQSERIPFSSCQQDLPSHPIERMDPEQEVRPELRTELPSAPALLPVDGSPLQSGHDSIASSFENSKRPQATANMSKLSLSNDAIDTTVISPDAQDTELPERPTSPCLIVVASSVLVGTIPSDPEDGIQDLRQKQQEQASQIQDESATISAIEKETPLNPNPPYDSNLERTDEQNALQMTKVKEMTHHNLKLGDAGKNFDKGHNSKAVDQSTTAVESPKELSFPNCPNYSSNSTIGETSAENTFPCTPNANEDVTADVETGMSKVLLQEEFSQIEAPTVIVDVAEVKVDVANQELEFAKFSYEVRGVASELAPEKDGLPLPLEQNKTVKQEYPAKSPQEAGTSCRSAPIFETLLPTIHQGETTEQFLPKDTNGQTLQLGGDRLLKQASNMASSLSTQSTRASTAVSIESPRPQDGQVVPPIVKDLNSHPSSTIPSDFEQSQTHHAASPSTTVSLADSSITDGTQQPDRDDTHRFSPLRAHCTRSLRTPASVGYKPRPIKDLVRRDLRSRDEVVVERALQQITIDCFYDYSARSLIARSGGVLSIVGAMEDHASNPRIQIAACQALEKLALDEDNEEAVAELGGIECILGAMMNHSENIRVQEAAWSALQNLTCSNAHSELCLDTNEGGVEMLVRAFEQHASHCNVAMHASATLANLCIPSETRTERIVQANGVVSLAKALQQHWGNKDARNEISHSLERLCESIASRSEPPGEP